MPGPEELTRRHFLRRAGAFAGAFTFGSVLAACGSDDPESAPTSPAGEDVESRLANAEGSVRTLWWEGYADEAAYAPLLEQGRIDLSQQFVNQDDVDMLAKRGTYDLGVAVDGIYPQLLAAGAVQPLDLDLVPNVQSAFSSEVLFDPATKTPGLTVQDGQAYGLPYAFGTLGVSYDAEAVDQAPETIEDFLSSAYTGRLAIVDDGPGVIIHVARHLGLGGTDSLGRSPAPTFLTPNEFDQVFSKLSEFKAQTRGAFAPYGDNAGAYARGEIIAAMPDWAPTVVAAEEGGLDVRLSVVPSSRTFIDCVFISADIQATDAHYAFLNQGLSEETQYAIGEALLLGVFNEDALNRLVDEGPAWDLYGDPEQLLELAPSQQWPPVESEEYVTFPDWLQRWEEFKAS